MINKKLLLITAILTTSCVRSMENSADIDRILAGSVKSARSIAAATQIPLETILARKILIIGPDVTVPLSELEPMDKVDYDKSLKQWITMLDPQGTMLGSFTPAEYEAFKKVIKLRVWRDASYGTGITSVTTNHYLCHTDRVTKKQCIAYLVAGSTEQNAFVRFHIASRMALTQVAQAHMLLTLNATSENIERALLSMFDLELPALVDDAALIAKTKQMLADLSKKSA